jgi:hypothetical protein
MINRTQAFELQAYPADEDNAILNANPEIEFENCRDIAAAKGKAGRLAKRINGPVDLAYAGNEPWNERYITTASPSEYHKSGFRFERLDG